MSEPSQPFEKPSKSQLKREATALQDLGRRLVDLTKKQLKALELPEDLLEAVNAAQAMPQREARHRQIKFIGGMMRDTEVATQHKIKQYFDKVGR